MFASKKSTSLQRANEAGVNVPVVCMHSKGSAMSSGAQMTRMTFGLLRDCQLQYAIKKNKPRADNDEHFYPALTNSHFLNAFNMDASQFQVGRVYDAIGLCLDQYVPKPEDNKSYDKLDSLTLAQLRPLQTSFVDYIPDIDFENRCFHPERDFPVMGEEYETKTKAGMVFIELVGEQACNQKEVDEPSMSDDWFPNQPSETIWGKVVVDLVKIKLTFTNLAQQTRNCLMDQGGQNNAGTPIQVYLRQRNADGSDIKICGSTVFYEDSISYFQTRNWEIMGSEFARYFQGSMMATINREKTFNMLNPDPNLFHHHVHLNAAFIPDLAAIVKEMGVKVDLERAKALVANKGAKKEKRIDPIPFMNAANLSMIRITNDWDKTFSPETWEYWVVGSHKWSEFQIEKLRAMSQEQILTAFMNEDKTKEYAWPKGMEQIVEVYAVKKVDEIPKEEKETKKAKLVEEVEKKKKKKSEVPPELVVN